MRTLDDAIAVMTAGGPTAECRLELLARAGFSEAEIAALGPEAFDRILAAERAAAAAAHRVLALRALERGRERLARERGGFEAVNARIAAEIAELIRIGGEATRAAS